MGRMHYPNTLRVISITTACTLIKQTALVQSAVSLNTFLHMNCVSIMQSISKMHFYSNSPQRMKHDQELNKDIEPFLTYERPKSRSDAL
jgi:hypothetical protein